MIRIPTVFFILLCAVIFANDGYAQPTIVIDSPKTSLRELTEFSRPVQTTFDRNEKSFKFAVAGLQQQGEEKVIGFPREIPDGVPIEWRATRIENGGVRLENPMLQMLADWEKAKNKIFNPSEGAFEKIQEIYGKIPSDEFWIKNELKGEIRFATMTAIMASGKDERARNFLVDNFYLQEKSYRGDQQLSFEVFQQATESCKSACAIRAKGAAKPNGSGVLVGNRLVLTCNHNFDGVPGGPKQFQAVFGFRKDHAGDVFEISKIIHQSTMLDFCLFELGSSIKGDKELPTTTQLGVRPQLKENAGIYVAGHPKGDSLKVALNAQVVFPFWVQDEKKVKVLSELALYNMFSSRAELDQHEKKYRHKVEEFFSSSYVSTEKGFYFKPKFNGDRFPVIGADPDAKSGDSGAPVFDLERNALVGLLRGSHQSKPDGDLSKGANYQFFEIITPISEIVAEMDAKRPGWKKEYSVRTFE